MLGLLLLAPLVADVPDDWAARSVVLITVDDMSCDSIGAFGCPVPETTPRIDALAAESVRLEHAHVQVGNCMPSRNVMMSGLYPHQNGVEGFRQIRPAKAKTLIEDLRDAGYVTAIRGKASHTTPFHPFPGWTLIDDRPFDPAVSGSKLDKKNPASFAQSVRIAAEAARTASQPLLLNVNVSDPHKPFYAGPSDPNQPSRTFAADEIVVPGFLTPLEDDAAVREEVALYYSSVRRADDAVGAILDALDDEGLGEALVIFLSDHGMPLPFAKTQLYHHSTRTPLLVRWRGRLDAGVDDRHVVSAVDLTPTVLDLLGIEAGRDFAGRSFAPVLRGEAQDGRDWAVMTYFENSGRNRHPMRTLRTRDWGYLFNPWSDGVRDFATATDATRSYKRLGAVAQENETARVRKELMDHRVREELYDYASDPDALENRIASDAAKAAELRGLLLGWMERHDDPMRSALEPWAKSQSDDGIAAYMAAQDELMRQIKTPKGQRAAQPKRRAKRFALEAGDVAVADDAVTVTIEHRLAAGGGSRSLVVTLKDGAGERIARQHRRVTGPGTETFTFERPDPATVPKLRVAAFSGPSPDYAESEQHETTPPVANAE